MSLKDVEVFGKLARGFLKLSHDRKVERKDLVKTSSFQTQFLLMHLSVAHKQYKIKEKAQWNVYYICRTDYTLVTVFNQVLPSVETTV